MNNFNFRDKIDEARFFIFMNDPFLGFILQNFDIILDDKIETAYTDGKHIVVGEQFLDKLELSEVAFILLHELLHIILNHIQRGQDYDNLRFNVACDIVVNDILDWYFYRPETLKPIYGQDFNIDSLSLTVEKVYELLPEKISIELIDIHGFWKVLSHEEIVANSIQVDKILKSAVTRGYSTTIESVRTAINNSYKQSNKNNWKYILRNYITRNLKDYSFERIDYRYKNVLLPSFIENEHELKDVWFVLDVSGSMSDSLIEIMFLEIEKIVKEYKSISCKMSFFSSITTKPIIFKDKKSLLDARKKIKSSWGTNYLQIFMNLENYFGSRKPKLIVILTDGYGTIPKKEYTRNIPVIWCSNNRNLIVPYGFTVYI